MNDFDKEIILSFFLRKYTWRQQVYNESNIFMQFYN